MAKPSALIHADEIAELVHTHRAGLFLDLDGTLAEFVPSPEEVAVRPVVLAALAALADSLPLLSVVTGRPAADAKNILGLDRLTYVGNHGLERLEAGRSSMAPQAAPYEDYIHEVLAEVRSRCDGTDAFFEEKRGSFTVHYRRSRHPEVTREAVMQAIHEIAGSTVKVLGGKAHVNVLPPVPVDKGTAVRSLIQDRQLEWALVAGDDVTDMDAFRELASLRTQGLCEGVCIAVLEDESPPHLVDLADYILAGVQEMEQFLVRLAQKAT